MLTKLRLRNFQAHGNLEIELGQVTTIVGRTDAGKSSILRGLIWLLKNRPGGTMFIQKGKSGCRVDALVDGRLVRRERAKANRYQLGNAEFVSFGTNVPEPIADHLNVNELNIQEQHDAPFWLTLTPSQLAGALDSIADLSTIDRAMKIARERRDQKRTDLAHLQRNVEEADAQIAALTWSKRAKARLIAIDGLTAQREALYSRLTRAKRTRGEILALVRGRKREQARLVLAGIIETRRETAAKLENVKACLAKKSKLVAERMKLVTQKARAERKLAEQMRTACPLCKRPNP